MGLRVAVRPRADRDRAQARNSSEGGERAPGTAIAEVSKQDRHRRIHPMQVPGTLRDRSKIDVVGTLNVHELERPWRALLNECESGLGLRAHQALDRLGRRVAVLREQ